MEEQKTVLGIDAAVFAGLVADALDRKMLGQGITNAVATAFDSYNLRSAVEGALRDQVREAATAIILEQYAEAIKEAVQQEVTQSLISSAAARSVSILKRQLED